MFNKLYLSRQEHIIYIHVSHHIASFKKPLVLRGKKREKNNETKGKSKGQAIASHDVQLIRNPEASTLSTDSNN